MQPRKIAKVVNMPEHTPAPTPHRAVYGFAFYLLFFTLFIIYTLWALLPTYKLGLTYLPDKYFALLLPIVVLTGLTFFVFLIYPAICMALTPDIDDLATVIDQETVRRICGFSKDEEINDWKLLKCSPPTINQNIKETNSVHGSKEPCEICQVVHQPTKLLPIATLRFMELKEVNEDIFGS